MNPADALTQNKFVDKLLKIVPENPLAQTSYLYYLSTIVFFGLFGFSIATWVQLFNHFDWTTLFRGVFMTAISLLSLFGVKQTRATYIMVRQMTANQEAKDKPFIFLVYFQFSIKPAYKKFIGRLEKRLELLEKE